jgi:hypothetical protein
VFSDEYWLTGNIDPRIDKKQRESPAGVAVKHQRGLCSPQAGVVKGHTASSAKPLMGKGEARMGDAPQWTGNETTVVSDE